MEDDDWNISAVVRSCNINGSNNVVAPNLGLKTFENDDWSNLDRLLADDIANFNSLPEISSIDFPVAHQEKTDNQVIIMDQNDNQQFYLHPIQPAQFNQQIFLPLSPATITCVPTTTTTPQEWTDLQQQPAMQDNFFPNLTLPIKTPLNQVIIMDQNDDQQFYLHPIQPTQFIQQIFLPLSPTMVTCVPTTTTIPQEWTDLQQQPSMQDNVYPNLTLPRKTPLDQTPIQFSQQIFLPPSPTTVTCAPTTTTTLKEWTYLQQQPVMKDNIYPNLTLPMKTLLIKTCKRKNQPIRDVFEVLQEELTNDKWTWRKYGQKSIKGFPFPRNYYKCSTSKLCEAKKIIEKSPIDENYFLVSYSGEHNHDPPTYRRPLIFYNSSSKYKLPRGINIVPRALSLNASSSSSKRAKRSKVDASSTSPIIPTLKIENNNEMVNVIMENKGDVEKEETMNEDILMGSI